MPIAFFAGASIVAPIDVWYEDSTSTKRRVREIWTKDAGGVLRQVYAITASPALVATVTPTSFVNVNVNSAYGAGNFSQTFTGAASGGSGSFTGAWTQLSGGPNAATATGTGSNTLTLAGAWPQHATREYSETWRYTATDSLGATAFTDITLYVSVGDNT